MNVSLYWCVVFLTKIVCLSVCLSICLPVYLSICLSRECIATALFNIGLINVS